MFLFFSLNKSYPLLYETLANPFLHLQNGTLACEPVSSPFHLQIVNPLCESRNHEPRTLEIIHTHKLQTQNPRELRTLNPHKPRNCEHSTSSYKTTINVDLLSPIPSFLTLTQSGSTLKSSVRYLLPFNYCIHSIN